MGVRSSEDDDIEYSYDDLGSESGVSTLEFTCMLHPFKYHLHTHAPAVHVLYRIGTSGMANGYLGSNRWKLSSTTAIRWTSLQQVKMFKVIDKIPPVKIRIPGGRMVSKK